jgi:2-polyprenyl-3-methyl-5-hydroxy-6-metoxy-1,4-benzoquinol methylase
MSPRGPRTVNRGRRPRRRSQNAGPEGPRRNSDEAGAAATQVPTGNTYDKYGSTNPVVRRLMASFELALDELFARASPGSVLDVGCGEGVLTTRWADRLGGGRIVGIDLPDPKLEAHWAASTRPNLEFMTGVAEELPFERGEFELVAAIETLEHVADPDAAIAELARVARAHVLASVPREPLWRALNIARGAYLGELGNTPGHLNHWSKGAFARLLARHGELVEVRSPLPWTMVLLRVG